MEEFNLSEKIRGEDDILDGSFIRTRYVKEFIKQVKSMIEFETKSINNNDAISRRLNSQIDIIAGDKLII